MSRISVSIPDELVARLEPIKDKLNVSLVCREALERRVASFERAAERQADEVDLDDLISRLREERSEVEGKFDQLGRRNAAAWLSTASYLELKNVAENHKATTVDRYRLPKAGFRKMRQDMEEVKAGLDGVHAVAYKTAWLDYVRTVWAEVAVRVEETNHNASTEAETGTTAEPTK